GVGATKSFRASLAAIVQLVAAWSNERALAAALEGVPQRLTRAWQLDWSALVTRLTAANNLYVIGRGPGLGVAQEAALKFKETCGLHAEAVSAAEVRHGPLGLVRAGVPLLAFSQHDASRPGLPQLDTEIDAHGAHVLRTGTHLADTTQ